jgi:ketosteroid isomerase-like protein
VPHDERARVRLRALGMVLVALCACASVARQPDHAQLVAEVTAAENTFARTMADRDHAGFLSFVAEDAVFLGARPLRGRAAVGEAWKPLFAGPAAPFSWKPELVDVNDAGTLALSTGPVSAPDGRVTSHYYSVWRRDADGRWRVVFDNGYDACDCRKQQ